MGVDIFTNTIADPEERRNIENAVHQAIGSRSQNEAWQVSIHEWQDSAAYFIEIEGPNDFKLEREFFGPDEQTPEFVRTAIEQAVRGL